MVAAPFGSGPENGRSSSICRWRGPPGRRIFENCIVRVHLRATVELTFVVVRRPGTGFFTSPRRLGRPDRPNKGKLNAFPMEGLILAQGERWRHASYMQVERSDAECLHSASRSGERVSNTWAICLEDGDNVGKLALIPDNPAGSHGPAGKWFFRLERSPRPISLLVG